MPNRKDNSFPLYRITVRGKDGFIDSEGRVVVEPRFEECLIMKDGRSVFRQGGTFGVIDDRGEVVSPAIWDSADLCYQDGLLLVAREGRRGFIDRKGRVAIEPRFAAAQFFVDGHAPVMDAEDWGGDGDVHDDCLWGYIDREGNFMIPARFRWADYFSEGIALVGFPACAGDARKQPPRTEEKDGNRGEPRRDSSADACVIDFMNFIFRAGANGGVGFIDKRGQPIFDQVFEGANHFHSGLAAVRLRGLWGFIDRRGEFVIPPIFYDIGFSFSEGLAPARFEVPWGPWGYIDRNACLMIPARYSNAEPFKNGLARVTFEGGGGFIDHAGNYAVKPEFSELGDFVDGLAPARLGPEAKFGFIDTTGQWAIPPRFDAVEWFQDGLARVNMGGTNCILYSADGGQWGYIDRSGAWVWKPTS